MHVINVQLNIQSNPRLFFALLQPMNHQSSPLITIIVAVFNGAKTLQQCIDSVAQQTYANKELIVIDGGSKDGSVDLLKENQEHISYWVSEPDRGIYNAWNKGLLEAKGDWIIFLGADDYLWESETLDKLVVNLVKIPYEKKVVYGQVMLLSTDDEILHKVGEPWQKIKRRFSELMCIPHQGVLHHRSLFDIYGGFDESFKVAGDYEILLRYLKINDAVFLEDIVIAGMRQGGVSSNPKFTLLTLNEIRRAQINIGIKMPGFFWVLAKFRVYVKSLLRIIFGETLARIVSDIYRRAIGLPAYWTKLDSNKKRFLK